MNHPRIVIICNETPYPPVHGGRLDVWNRIVALSAEGVKIFLICWTGGRDEVIEQEVIAKIESKVESLAILPAVEGPVGWLKKLILLFKYPWYVSARITEQGRTNELVLALKSFAPDLVMVESIYGALLAKKLADRFNIPLIVRSHNIEHQYLQVLASTSTSFRQKLQLRLAQIGLERYEVGLMRHCAWFFDCSFDDLQYWKINRGLSNGEWLPLFINSDEFIKHHRTSYQWDVVYLGNLNSPNNVEGVSWFCSEVVPLLFEKLPKLRILIAGANPSEKIKSVCEESGVSLLPNPTSAIEVFCFGRVLINVVLRGSGITTKTIEMLFTGAPIVSTPQGIKGLPQDLKNLFYVGDSAKTFAQGIIKALSDDSDRKTMIAPSELNQIFGEQAVARFESRLLQIAAGDVDNSRKELA